MLSSLGWPIKESLLDYLAALEDATVEVDGAERTTNGFHFPVDSSRADGASFQGTVRMTAHGGMLNVEIGFPQIVRVGSDVMLRVSTPSGAIDLARILDYPADDALLLHSGGVVADIALTTAGSALLGNVYGPWTRLAPMTLVAN
ncbi:HtaA domain-containing protein [Agromyces sp. NPDC049794]|uniref:HtaA domain-containing protein n=1 Tax=unclassified Agromyces TaxID=2639701 RepID=UPI0033DA00F6